jgi:DNA-binding GntR family transcriptional regulator
VREALQRLVQEGLAVNTQNKGVCVVDLQIEDLVDIYVARRAVEREAFMRAFRLKTEALIGELRRTVLEMEAALAADNWREYVDLNTKFHSLIVDAARSPRLSRIYSTLSAEFRLCSMKEKPLYTYPTGLPENHRKLVDLLETGPVSDLLAELDRHLNGGIERLPEISGR